MAAGRYLLFTVFFLALATGPAAQALMVLLRRRRWRVPVPTLILLAVVVDLGPATFQQVYYSTLDPPANMAPELRAHADSLDAHGQLPSHRIFWRSSRYNLWVQGQLYIQLRTPSPNSPDVGKARAVADFVQPIDRYLSKLVEMGYFAIEDSIDADPQGQFHPERVDAGFMKMLTDSYHALFLVVNTGVDPETRVCKRIYVLDAEGRELDTNPAVEVLEHTVRMQRVDLKLRVSEACFARLAYSYFPHLRVAVDGREVAPLRTAGGFMAVQLEAGERHLTLEAELSPLRRVLLAVNLLYLAATVVLFVGNSRRKRQLR